MPPVGATFSQSARSGGAPEKMRSAFRWGIAPRDAVAVWGCGVRVVVETWHDKSVEVMVVLCCGCVAMMSYRVVHSIDKDSSFSGCLPRDVWYLSTHVREQHFRVSQLSCKQKVSK